jgi:hypothetical protein
MASANPFRDASASGEMQVHGGIGESRSPRGIRETGTIATCPFITYAASIGGAMYVAFLVGLVLHMNTAPLIILGCTAGGLAGGLVFSLLDISHPEEGRK